MKWLVLFLFCFSLCAKEIHPMTKVNHWLQAEKELTEGRFLKLATLATIGPDGSPHTRLIELTKLDPKNGAVFYTHSKTRKVEDLTFNSRAALNLWLPRTHRQVSLEGIVTQISSSEAERAWNQMPRFIKFTFMGSKHEGLLESPTVLEIRRAELQKKYADNIPMPENFVGYSFQPTSIIFFEVHGRDFSYKEVATLEKDKWTVCVLEP